MQQKIDANSGAPSAGLLLHFIPSFLVIVCVPRADAYDFILSVEGYPIAIIGLFVVIGLFILRHKEPHIPRPFKVNLMVAVVFMAAQVFLIIAPFTDPTNEDTAFPYWLYPVVGILVLLSGVCYWGVWRILMPRLGNFKWSEKHEVLHDGTVVKRYVRIKND